MALENENGFGTTMLVQPTGNANNGFGFGGDGLWFLILFFLLAGNGWNGFCGGMFGMDGLYPWMNQNNQINDGFRDQMLNTSISGIQNSITSGFGDVQNSLCAGFAGVNATVNGAQNAIAQQMYTNQIADLERSFAAQTANTAGLNNVAMNLQSCCCENRANVADLKYTVATENCADRAALSDGIRDVLAATQAQTQTILDKLCQQEIDALKTANNNLQTQVLMRDLAASQNAQTAALTADNAAQTQYIVNRVAPYPQPAIVYGYNTNWMSGCGCNTGCGCGA